MPTFRDVTAPRLRLALLGTSLLALVACTEAGSFDEDFRRFGKGNVLNTSDAALDATQDRPSADNRGIITYSNYQVAVARQGDTVESIAARTGIPAQELASYNAIAPGTPLRKGEVVALPRRVAAAPAIGSIPQGPVGSGISASGGQIDVTSLASGAIDRAAGAQPMGQPAAPVSAAPAAGEPVRHKVLRGETAYTIARLYNVNVRSLADWNGLGSDLAVREGQILMIPVPSGNVATAAAQPAVINAPGTQSATPVPPSAATPLPAEKTKPAAQKESTPKVDVGKTTAASAARLAYPVQGKIIREYKKGKNEGLDIAASAGAPVKAAAEGTVAAITKDTGQIPILVLRHANGLLTVYANVDGIAVEKGAKVSRGQTIAKVRAGDPAFLHFEVRQGLNSVDPVPYLQ